MHGGSGGGLGLSGCTHGKKVDFFEELLLVVLEFSDHYYYYSVVAGMRTWQRCGSVDSEQV